MNFLVLGGTGLLGNAVVQRLVKIGHAVNSVSRHTPTNRSIAGVQYNLQALTDIDALKPLLTWADVIVHLASSGTPHAKASVYEFMFEEVLPVSKILEEIKGKNKRFLYTSSGGAVYGKTDGMPIVEDSPRNPVSPYGLAKVAAEDMIQYYHRLNEVTSLILRPSNVYGPKFHTTGKQGFISTLINNLFMGEPTHIWTSLNTAKDYLYVNDFADIVIKLIQSKAQGVFNVGSGKSYTLREIIELVELKSGKKIHYTQPTHILDDVNFVLDLNKLNTQIGQFSFTSLDLGLSELISSGLNR